MLGKGVNGHWRATTGEESANYDASQLLLPLQGARKPSPSTLKVEKHALSLSAVIVSVTFTSSAAQFP